MSIFETKARKRNELLQQYENQEFLIWSNVNGKYMVYWDADPDKQDFTDSPDEAEAYNFSIAIEICLEANKLEPVLTMLPVAPD
ncbi:MAG: hypothetical protein ACR2PS_06090 [Pseudomonadales bacterium]